MHVGRASGDHRGDHRGREGLHAAWWTPAGPRSTGAVIKRMCPAADRLRYATQMTFEHR